MGHANGIDGYYKVMLKAGQQLQINGGETNFI
jgi:hypothetical protein